MNDLRRILVVADDVMQCNELRSVFGQLPPEWKVYFSSSASDALSYLDQVGFDIIFADLNAGMLAGAQFLHEVWARHPNIIRFLLGTQLDPDIMLTCVMAAHQFLLKPLQTHSVQAALERANTMQALLADRQLQTLVSRIRTFPARPRIYLEVMREVRSENGSVRTVGELVSKDLAISTKLLQVINSAAFGLAQKVSSPSDAVMLIGMQTTASLVLGIEAFAQLDRLNATEFPVDRLWRHSQNVAITARTAAHYFTRDSATAHDSFTAGLLHDLGKLALAMNFPEEYQFALAIASERQIPEWVAEKEVLGATHAEAGAYLLALWGLPAAIIQAVGSHHNPANELGGQFSAVGAVHLANVLENSRAHHMVFGPEQLSACGYPEEYELVENFEGFQEALGFLDCDPEMAAHAPMVAGA